MRLCLEQNAIMSSFSSSLRQPNAWPSEEMWNQSCDFRVIIEEYYEQTSAIHRYMLDCTNKTKTFTNVNIIVNTM